MSNKISRRFFIYLSLAGIAFTAWSIFRNSNKLNTVSTNQPNKLNGPTSHIYVVKNGTPQQNVTKTIEMMGGIKSLIGVNDIVVLKPNAQWWNQGRTNLAAMKGFIDLVLGIHGFKGEVIIAENHHFMDESLPEGDKDNIRGWTHYSDINGDIDGVNHNLNTMIELFQRQ